MISKIIKTQEKCLTKNQIFQILRNADLKLKSAILISSSGGLSTEELSQLRFLDIDFTSKPTKILVRISSSKNKTPRQTFITEEATLTLKDYLKKYFGWHKNSLNLDLKGIYVFDRISKIKDEEIYRFSLASTKQSLQISLRNHIKNIPELSVKNEKGRNGIYFHEFGKFFKTTVGNVCDRDFAEALGGRKFYVDSFYQLSEDDKRQKYLSAEPYLTISDF